MIPAVIIALLILLNGVFVAAEFAIIGSPRVALDRMARKGNRLAALVHGVLRNPQHQDRYIATAQLGITSASLGLGMYGEHLLAEWLVAHLDVLGVVRWIGAHTIASIIAVAFLTYLHVVLGEMVPKSLALQSPAKMAMGVAIPMRAMEVVLYPLVAGLNGIGNGILKLLGVERSARSAESYRTPAELRFIVAESRAGGLLAGEPARIIQELLEFAELNAAEVMVPRTSIVGFAVGADRYEVAHTMEAAPHTRFPVYEGGMDNIVGVVHVKDLLTGLRHHGRLDRSLLRDVPFIPATQHLDRVLTVLRATRSHMAVVLDEHGGTAGILTLEDLFEEVAGDIADPGERPAIRTDETGHTTVAGTVRLDELGEVLQLELEHEEIDTVSGLVIAMLGRPPTVGDRVEYEKVVLEVSAVRGRGVQEARVVSTPKRERR